MLRFFPNAKRSLDSLLILITDLVTDGLLFFRLLFRSRTALGAEVLFLRKQLAFYEERQVQPRRLNDSARFSLILWSRLCDWKEALVIVKPETLIGWHRKGFKLFWKWKSQAGRPRIPENIRKLIVQMAQENPTWGQARVAAELSVKLGICVSPRTVRAHWPPEPERRGRRRTSSQNWRTFVRNHAQSIVACDFLVVVTARFRTLYVFLVMEVGTRRIDEYRCPNNPTRLLVSPRDPQTLPVWVPSFSLDLGYAAQCVVRSLGLAAKLDSSGAPIRRLPDGFAGPQHRTASGHAAPHSAPLPGLVSRRPRRRPAYGFLLRLPRPPLPLLRAAPRTAPLWR